MGLTSSQTPAGESKAMPAAECSNARQSLNITGDQVLPALMEGFQLAARIVHSINEQSKCHKFIALN